MADATLGVARSVSTHIQTVRKFTLIAGCVLGVTFGLFGVILRILAIEIALLQRVGLFPFPNPEDDVPSNHVGPSGGVTESSVSCH